MRHFLSPRTIAPGTRGMIVSTARGRLVALPGCALFAAPALLGAASLTVDVAAIAARTDQDLDAAAHTEIQTRGCICLFAFVTQTWTKAPTDGILPRHRASARCGARRRYKLPGWDRRRACLQQRQAFNSSSSAESPDAHRSSAAQRIPIPAPQRALRAAIKGDGFSSQEPIARGAPDRGTATAVRSSAAQDAALVNRKHQATAVCRSTPTRRPCSEASMRARYRKGCGPLRHE
jgi:hypothetical protein